MKIHILSDLHLEFLDFEPPKVEADLVVLAGDIGTRTNGIDWAIRTWWGLPPWDHNLGHGTPIVYVRWGNSENKFFNASLVIDMDT